MLVQAAISLAVSTLLCVGIYAMTAPSRFSPLYSLGMGLLFAISIAVTRVWLVEHQWQVTARNNCFLPDCTALPAAANARPHTQMLQHTMVRQPANSLKMPDKGHCLWLGALLVIFGCVQDLAVCSLLFFQKRDPHLALPQRVQYMTKALQ